MSPMHDISLIGGSVLTASGVEDVDVGITDGIVASIGEDIGPARRTIDCTSTWVGPGFVDVHAHLREPGQEWKEDIETGSRAAAAGGYTALVAMANTDPAVDEPGLARYVQQRGEEVGKVHVVSAGCLTIGRQGKEPAAIDELWEAGVRVFTDDGDVVQDRAVLRSLMEHIADLGGVISQHAVDGPLSRAGHMHQGAVSEQIGIDGIPREADNIIIHRDIALARLTGVRYHIQHLSTAEGVALVEAAKREGLRVTAEATPHHLMFQHEDVASGDTRYKMMPPLRDSDDRRALMEGLRTGSIDLVATDHAPHAATEKDVPFTEAMNGVTGLEWAAAVVNTVVGLDQIAFFDRMAVKPALLAGFAEHGEPLAVGRPANVVVFDTTERWTPTTTESKSHNAPYLGRELKGRVRATIFNGALTYGGDS